MWIADDDVRFNFSAPVCECIADIFQIFLRLLQGENDLPFMGKMAEFQSVLIK